MDKDDPIPEVPAEPIVEPVVPAEPEAPADPAPAPVVEPIAAAPAPTPEEDWRDKRLAKKSAQLDAAKAELAALKAGGSPVLNPNSPEFEAAVQAKIAKKEFDAACDSAVNSGKIKFTDFEDVIKQGVNKVLDRNDPESVAAYNQFLQAGIETGKLDELVYSLSKDPNEFNRVLSLPPVKMAVEVAKLAAKEPDLQPGAPRPIAPVTARGGSRELIDPADKDRSDQLSTATWMERRERQIAERAQAGRGRNR